MPAAIEREQEPMSPALRIAMVTDIHYGPDRHSKSGAEAIMRLANFVARANALGVDLAVDLGDRISNTDAVADRAYLEEIAPVFQTLRMARYHLVGNHDVMHLSVREQEELLGVAMTHQSVDVKGRHLVFWNASCVLHGEEGFRLEQEDLAWLEADLAATRLPSVVFCHMPVDAASLVGNRYFERRYAGGGQHGNAHLAREVIERSEKVIAVVAGHVHWNRVFVMDGIPHFALQSLSETFTTHPHPAAAWGLLTLTDTMEFEVFGLDPVKYTLPVKSLSHHWLPPLE